MKMILNLAIAATLATSLSGCIVVGGDRDWDSNSWESKQEENRDFIANLALGTSRSAILSELGAANFSEAFSQHEDEYRVLFYRTQRVHSDSETTKDETTPLIFKNDQLVGWGMDTLNTIRGNN